MINDSCKNNFLKLIKKNFYDNSTSNQIIFSSVLAHNDPGTSNAYQLWIAGN
jgi:cyclophilin family peptidyl-prolyl cis-trans isomerase